MYKQNINQLEDETQEKYNKKDKKIKKKMKVSGAKVKDLQKIIKNKNN